MDQTKTQYEKRWAALTILCISLLIIAIDTTVLNMSIPSISGSLGASTAQLMWIMDSYTVVFASLMLTTGTLGDRFGRKKILTIGLIVFGLGSLGAAQSNTTSMLIFFRVFQGIGGSMMMPCTLSLIVNIFPDHAERSRALAIWGGTFGIGAGVGPLIGGVLLNFFEWPAVFYLNIPVVLIGLIGGYLVIPESRNPKPPKLDIPGLLLSSMGIFALVYGIIKAGEIGWGAIEVLGAIIAGMILIGIFLYWEKKTPAPMLPLHFFKNQSFSAGSITMFMNAFAIFGAAYFFSQYFQSVLGYSPLLASLAMTPQLVIQYLATINSVNVVKRYGTKRTIAFGLMASGIGYFMFTSISQVDSSYLSLIGPLLLLGIGMGHTMTPAMTSTLGSLPPSRAGIGSGIADTFMNIGGALGFAVSGSIMNGFYRLAVNKGIKTFEFPPAVHEMFLSSVQNALIAAEQVSAEWMHEVSLIAKNAFVYGMDHAMWFIGAFLIGASLVVFKIVPASIQYASDAEEKKDH
ncbi:MAG: MFS transporter [Anaerolineaceae bacterium]|nr:MFS transporter [Anaerolineaceae bacterium]